MRIKYKTRLLPGRDGFQVTASAEPELERSARKAMELKPCIPSVYQAKTVRSAFNIKLEGGSSHAGRLASEVRVFHYTSFEGLEGILANGLKQNSKCGDPYGIWVSTDCDWIKDSNKAYVIFDIPKGTPVEIMNDTQLLIMEDLPPSCIVTIDFPVGTSGVNIKEVYDMRKDGTFKNETEAILAFESDPDYYKFVEQDTLEKLIHKYYTC